MAGGVDICYQTWSFGFRRNESTQQTPCTFLVTRAAVEEDRCGNRCGVHVALIREVPAPPDLYQNEDQNVDKLHQVRSSVASGLHPELRMMEGSLLHFRNEGGDGNSLLP